jgi:16S rRNA (cytosine1402-N4)-methyltransferase
LETQHQPVLLRETIDALAVGPNDDVLDATFGGGGHAESILEHSSPNGRLLGLDRDPKALEYARERLARFTDRVTLVSAPFTELGAIARDRAFIPRAILLDLGISMDQVRDFARGFSFAHSGPLDMRYDPSQALTAALVLSRWKEESLALLFKRFDEPLARPIAHAIALAKRSIETTTDLADLVATVYAERFRTRSRRHPATRVFLALRAAVNDELGQIERALPDALDLLPPEGRLAVISFHSAEDRLVKNVFRTWALGCTAPVHEPGCSAAHEPRVRLLSRKPITPSRAEVTTSPASRSARLRVVVKLESVTH